MLRYWLWSSKINKSEISHNYFTYPLAKSYEQNKNKINSSDGLGNLFTRTDSNIRRRKLNVFGPEMSTYYAFFSSRLLQVSDLSSNKVYRFCHKIIQLIIITKDDERKVEQILSPKSFKSKIKILIAKYIVTFNSYENIKFWHK